MALQFSTRADRRQVPPLLDPRAGDCVLLATLRDAWSKQPTLDQLIHDVRTFVAYATKGGQGSPNQCLREGSKTSYEQAAPSAGLRLALPCRPASICHSSSFPWKALRSQQCASRSGITSKQSNH